MSATKGEPPADRDLIEDQRCSILVGEGPYAFEEAFVGMVRARWFHNNRGERFLRSDALLHGIALVHLLRVLTHFQQAALLLPTQGMTREHQGNAQPLLHLGAHPALLSAESVRAMQEAHSDGFGLGWWRDLPGFVHHMGGGVGYFTELRVYRERGLGLVAMCNTSGGNGPIHSDVRRVLDLLAEELA